MDGAESNPKADLQPDSDAAARVALSRRWWRGVLAVLVTIPLPGLGHWFLGFFRRGLLFLTIVLILHVMGVYVLLSPGSSLALLLACAVVVPLAVLIACIDVVRCHLRVRHRTQPYAAARFLATMCVAGAVMYISPSMRLAEWIHTHYVETFVLPGTKAMAPTMQPGDMLLCHKHVPIRRWDIVVYEHEQFDLGTAYVSRIVGLPGETVEIVDGRILVNGTSIDPPSGVGPYAQVTYQHGRRPCPDGLLGTPGAGCEGRPITLGHDEYYVLGDNTDNSLDSRLWTVASPHHQLGALPTYHITGRVTAIYFPWDRQRRF